MDNATQDGNMTAQHKTEARRGGRTLRRMLAVGALGAALLIQGLASGPSAGAQTTSSKVVATLYGAPNYGGGEHVLYEGSMWDFSGNTWDDVASSIKVTPGTMVALYRDPELTGVCEVITADDPNLANNRIGDNQVTTIHVGAPCYASVARLYRDLNGTGESRVVGMLGSWEGRDLRRSDFNDTTTSIRVPAGQVISVYEHTSFGGKCETFRGGDADLRNNFIGNDSISSVRFGKACGEPSA